MAAKPRRVRLWLFRLATALCALVVGFLAAECTIRTFPTLLNDKLRHAAFSKYDTLPGGIFLFEGLTRSRVMRADRRTRAYSHGYFWTHETDRHGYRNPAGIDDHGVLLLGDSLVYGHGVESDETVAHFLRTRHHVSAYDMSAQGQCIYEHYLALRLHLESLRPRVVLLFVYVNDIHDLEVLSRTAHRPEVPETRAFDYDVIRARIERLNAYRDPLPVRLAFSSVLCRMAAKTHGWRPARPPESATPTQWRPPQPATQNRLTGTFAAVLDDSRFEPTESYYELVLADVAERAKRISARLVVIHLVPPNGDRNPARDQAQTKLSASLQALCDRLEIEEIDTLRFFSDRTEWILPGDGHLNPDGHRALARYLAREVLDTN